MTDEAVTIKVMGDGKQHFNQDDHGKEMYREFQCFGRKNPDGVCGKCNIRFECFSTAFNEAIEIPIARFGKTSLQDLDASMVAKILTTIDFRSVKRHFDVKERRTITSRAKINFADVRER